MRINCHVPITLRIVGVPTDDQLALVAAALIRAVTDRLAEAERVLADRHGHSDATVTEVREQYAPARAHTAGYAVPSYQLAGNPVVLPLPDLDANEAAARLPGTTLVDPARPATENEAAVAAIALEIFGSREAVDAMFATLSPLVQQEVDSQHRPEGSDQRTDHRLQFFLRMRLYFPSWQAVLDHFRNFDRVRRPGTAVSGEVDIVLHHDAAVRLERVLTVLANHNHPFPTIYGGFQLRHFEEGEIKSYGYMIHALGYAVDIAAATNPKIGFMKRGGAGQFDPYQIAAAIDPSGAHMDMGPGWPAAVEAMGRRTATDHTSAAEDQDPVAKRIFEVFEQRFRAMAAGSLGFIGTLSADHRTKLLDVRQRYFAVLRALRLPADPKTLADLRARRISVLREIPPLVTEWITALDAEIGRSLAKHPGMDRMRAPDVIRADLRHAEKNVQQTQQEDQRARTATATAVRRRDAAVAKVRPSGKDWAPTPAAALTELAAAREAADDALRDEMLARRLRERAVVTRDQLKAELATSDTPALRPAWEWITKVGQLREELAAPDLSTPAGLATFEALTTGNLSTIAPADNPPLLRLLEVGFFNPTAAFDLDFFAEMAHSGFVPGATWQFGGADPMHFELQEGRNRILPPGTPAP